MKLTSYPQIYSMIYAVCAAALMIIRCPGSTFLRCSDDSFYVGSARDLEYRLQQHAIGCVDAYTETRRPVSLAWAQECEPIEDAYVLEHKIKGWRREKKIALIEGRFGDLPRLSRAGSHKHVEENIQT